MPEPIAAWNSARGVWETQELNMLCGHAVPFSETFPTSGMWDGTGLYPLPAPEHPIAANGCSSSPGLLKTPTAQLAVNGGSQHPDRRREEEGGHGPTLADQVEHELLLPTPAARDWRSGQSNLIGTNARPLSEVVEMTLLPTPRATDGTNGGPNQRGSSGDLMLPSAVTALLPTPTAQAAKHAEATPYEISRTEDKHNLWETVNRILPPSSGETMSPRSGSGRPSSGGQLPLPLNLDGQG